MLNFSKPMPKKGLMISHVHPPGSLIPADMIKTLLSALSSFQLIFTPLNFYLEKSP